jgi:aspartyl protease family protein
MRGFRIELSSRRAGMAMLLAAAASAASAQSVTLNGRLGTKQALLVIDGEPHAVSVGSSIKGVQLAALTATQADVVVGGQRRTLAIGAGPVKVSASAPQMGNAIVLTASAGGHFNTVGQINGKSVSFMVDTGATKVSMGQAEAERLGVDYKSGTRGLAETANGRVSVYAVTLNSVRVGDVEVANVEALVLPASMPHVLLGNSFLTRFSMKRDNEIMRLEKRPS